ncbi:amyloid-beta A4 precursor protein-binding family A member 2 isoform X2 [Periophthalmus magnuspinnatus]|uniref:amyloid-beta A4 precursor protein-binding family A member 2 isoform X2 n=1 Tax=Periophthalmus magnuspinnatus TaxID=409849 RepID=UPI00145BF802|nr:amyloid-beta A4 precursor protein-binding family A member 2 isoform X2 [Periophthalmus magnuspinnatus]
MAHVKRPGTSSKAPSPSLYPARAGSTSQETNQGLEREESESLQYTSKDVQNDQLTVPQHHYTPHVPGPVDMEDTGSEYDNVGSDVEQDYDEVLHLPREGAVDMRYYRQYCPEEAGYLKHHAVTENINENSGAARVVQDTQVYQPSQAETKPGKERLIQASHNLQAAAAKCNVVKGQENSYFFTDGDDIEEVLVGVKFVEDLEEHEQNHPQMGEVSVYECSRNEKVVEIDRVARNQKNPEFTKRSDHIKDRPGKGRGRRGTAQCMENSVAKAGSTNGTDQHPRMDHKRTKAKPSSSNKQKPPPPPRHPHPPPPATVAQRREIPSSREAPQLPGQDSPLQAATSVPNPPQNIVEYSIDLEEKPNGPEPSQQIQDEETSTVAKLKHSLEQPRRPQSPQPPPPEENGSPKITQEAPSFPCFEDVPGPCEPEDLIDGIIFAANYLGCTQVLSDKNPTKSVRMSQAQEAVNHIKSQDEDSQMTTEVDLFISTKAVKVLNADTQETMMDSALRTISYIADIGNIVVIMARTPMSQSLSEELSECPVPAKEGKNQYRMICYVFESEDAQLIAQSIGQAFSVAYREFLRANGINPTDLSQKQYSDIINSQEMYHDDLVHFSNSDNCKELYIEKQKGEILGVVIVESGWGSILPTVILAGMLNNGPAARSGKLSVGDQIMSINDTSLVGLPLATCQGIIKGLKNHVKVKLSIVSCPPVTTVLIKRPDLKFQLGFSVQNGIICSLMRGGIAERGGVRVGHRIIEINGQSVVAMAHEKIVQTLSVSVGEINMKTMPAVMFRLLTGQETPIYI